MVSPSSEGLPFEPEPESSQTPSPSTPGFDDKDALNRSSPPLSMLVAVSARQYLKDLFAGIVEQVLPDRARITEPAAHNHITLLLVMNLRGERLQDCLELGDAEMRSTGHRFRMAHQLTLILDCCHQMEGDPRMIQPLADLYTTLADHLIFLKGMFQIRDVDHFLDLNATRLPSSVRRINDVGEYAYHRASQLILDQDTNPDLVKKSQVLRYLGDHVSACIMGLRYVRQELDALPYEIKDKRQILVFGGSLGSDR